MSGSFIQSVGGLLKLSRASLAPSSAADALAGYAVAAGALGLASWSQSAILLAVGCSLALFLFGMALNDLSDQKKDARGRPDRPLPSGAVSVRSAWIYALSLAGFALLVVFLRGDRTPQILVVTMLVTIVTYNRLPGHGGVAGPILLGLVRGQNLCLGAAIGGAVGAAFLPAALYALFIAAVSFAARMEDGEVPYRRTGLIQRIRLAEAAAIAVPIVATGKVQVIPLAISAYLVFRIERAMRQAVSVDPPPPPALPRLIGACLGSIVLLDASLALAVGSPVVAAALLVFFPFGRRLVMRFPPS